MTSRKLVLVVCVLCVGVAFMVGQAKPPETDAGGTEAGLMRAKLASSQKVVEGLMVQDLSLVRTGALELEKICKATEWHANEDQVYAQDDDLDGATYTYMHSITTCMNCHTYCRDVLHVARTEPNLRPTPDANGKVPPTIILR